MAKSKRNARISMVVIKQRVFRNVQRGEGEDESFIRSQGTPVLHGLCRGAA